MKTTLYVKVVLEVERESGWKEGDADKVSAELDRAFTEIGDLNGYILVSPDKEEYQENEKILDQISSGLLSEQDAASLVLARGEVE